MGITVQCNSLPVGLAVPLHHTHSHTHDATMLEQKQLISYIFISVSSSQMRVNNRR